LDANSFTLIRLLSGAVILLLLSSLLARKPTPKLIAAQNATTLSHGGDSAPVEQGVVTKGNWLSAYFLYQYAICFSLAYTLLSAASGALILFAAVQITMIAVSLLKGQRLHYLEWLGALLAFAGFAYLMSPGISAPSPLGFVLMLISGISWGAYTLRGRRSQNPLNDTTWNFVRSLPFIFLTLAFFWRELHIETQGVWFAIASGGVASGIGYAIWYKTLPRLGTTQAAVVQLSVPVLTAIAGIVWVNEAITWRLFIAGIFILGGILLVSLKPYTVEKSA